MLVLLFILIILVFKTNHLDLLFLDYFHEGKLKYHLSIMIAEKILFSILSNYDHDWQFYAIVELKLIIVIFSISSDNFVEKSQKVRSIAVQILHLLLLVVHVFNKEFLNGNSIKFKLPEYLIHYFELGIILSVIIISLLFILFSVIKIFH
jgi:hypothetical protein